MFVIASPPLARNLFLCLHAGRGAAPPESPSRDRPAASAARRPSITSQTSTSTQLHGASLWFGDGPLTAPAAPPKPPQVDRTPGKPLLAVEDDPAAQVCVCMDVYVCLCVSILVPAFHVCTILSTLHAFFALNVTACTLAIPHHSLDMLFCFLCLFRSASKLHMLMLMLRLNCC